MCTGGYVYIIYLPAPGHRLGPVDQGPALGKVPAIHDEDFQVVRLVIHFGGQGIADAAAVGVVAAFHPGLPVVEPEQQIMVAHLFVETHGGAKGGLVVVDQQAEERVLDNRVIERLVFKGNAHHQIAGVTELPAGAVGHTPGFHILEEVTALVVFPRLVGVLIELGPGEGTGKLLIVICVEKVEAVFHRIADLPAGVGINAAALLLLVLPVTIVAALLHGHQRILVTGHDATGNPALHGAVGATTK